MTEADWLKAKDPDAMLKAVGGRLSPRQWHLLAAGVVRRTWDLLADADLRAAVEWAEDHAGEPGRPDLADRMTAFHPAARRAADAVMHEERLIVSAANPDADPESYRHMDARRTNPAVPLFQSATRAAGEAVTLAGDAAGHAAEAVAHLLTGQPGPNTLDRIREVVTTALRVRAAASLNTSLALKLKALGDEWADRDPTRNVRLRYATALEAVQREYEYAGYRQNDLHTQKERADRKALGRLLHELCGNPFRRRFDANWRTSTVVGLATAIEAARAFDRMPILADALMEADCDDEPILRHCRGTEPHAPDGAAHGRGCWVLDLILEREPAFFSAAPPGRRGPVRRRAEVRDEGPVV